MLAATLVGGSLAGCAGPSDLSLPDAEDVESYYESQEGLEAELVGNVAVITVAQSARQLRRGGRLWAKVGPYVYLFTEETFQLLEDYPGLAAVRVVTRVGGSEVANAILPRDELSGVLWRRSLNISGQARRDGTNRVTLLEDLVEWGEAHTEFTYNTRYTSR
jgi:hypothetical protein